MGTPRPPGNGSDRLPVAIPPKLAPPQPTYSDKEIVPSFYEKEVVVDASESPQVLSNGGGRVPFRLRNPPSDPRLAKLDMSAVSRTSSGNSLPASPAEAPRDPSSAFHLRNPALTAAASKFGGPSAYPEMSSPVEKGRSTPPKPVGFSYNPRDLRNAMLNRQAAESAAALSSASAPFSGSETPNQSFAAELPGLSIVRPRPSAETLGRASTTSRASASTAARSIAGEPAKLSPEPVELSAMPSQRKTSNPSTSSHTPTASTAAAPTTPAKPLNSSEPTVRENVIMPVVETRAPMTSHHPPPPPPKDDPSHAPANMTRELSTDNVQDKKLREKLSTDALLLSDATETESKMNLSNGKLGLLGKDKVSVVGD